MDMDVSLVFFLTKKDKTTYKYRSVALKISEKKKP